MARIVCSGTETRSVPGAGQRGRHSSTEVINKNHNATVGFYDDKARRRRGCACCEKFGKDVSYAAVRLHGVSYRQSKCFREFWRWRRRLRTTPATRRVRVLFSPLLFYSPGSIGQYALLNGKTFWTLTIFTDIFVDRTETKTRYVITVAFFSEEIIKKFVLYNTKRKTSQRNSSNSFSFLIKSNKSINKKVYSFY